VVEFAPVIEQSVPHLYLSALAFAPQRSKLFQHYSPSYPRILRCEGSYEHDWPSPTQSKFAASGHNGQVTALTFSPDGTELVSGSADATVRLWSADTGEALVEPHRGHRDWIIAVAFTPDYRHVLSASYDNTLGVWETKPTEFPPLSVDSRASIFAPRLVHCAAFSRDGKLVVTGPSLCIWDTEMKSLIHGPLDECVSCVAISPDGKRVASGSTIGLIKVWSTRTGECLAGPFWGHMDRVSAIAFSHCGSCIVSGSHDHTVRLWDSWTGEIDVVAVFTGHRDWVTAVSFSPDTSRIVSGSRDNTIRVWATHTGCVVAGPFFGHTNCVNVVTFSPDGKRIASGSRDKTIRLWEVIF
jgi:WD40 repeat protein